MSSIKENISANYNCSCGEALDIDDGLQCRECYGAKNIELISGELAECPDCKKENEKMNAVEQLDRILREHGVSQLDSDKILAAATEAGIFFASFKEFELLRGELETTKEALANERKAVAFDLQCALTSTQVARAEAQKLKEELETTKRALEGQIASNLSLIAEQDPLEQDLAKCLAACHKLKAENEALAKERMQSEENLRQFLTTEKEVTRRVQEASEKEIANLKNTLSITQEHLVDKNKEIERLHQEIDGLKSDVRVISKQRDGLRAIDELVKWEGVDVEALQPENEALKSRVVLLESTLSANLKEYLVAKGKLDKEIERLNSELNEALRLKSKYDTDRNFLTEDLHKLKKEFEVQKAEHAKALKAEAEFLNRANGDRFDLLQEGVRVLAKLIVEGLV